MLLNPNAKIDFIPPAIPKDFIIKWLNNQLLFAFLRLENNALLILFSDNIEPLPFWPKPAITNKIIADK